MYCLRVKSKTALFFKIYQCILVNLRQVHYVYADVECASYPMDTIDTVLDDGRIDRNSVLYFAVFGVIIT